jgi:hypothetical protein
MYYFGTLKNNKMIEIFYSKTKPTEQTHGNLYGYVTGGYKTKTEALQQADYIVTWTKNIVCFDGRKKSDITRRSLCMIAGII